MTRELRKDVYDSGCGWEDCPTCGPLIEAEKQVAHRRAIRWPSRDAVVDWQALEAAEETERKGDAETMRKARWAKKQAEAKARVRRVLTPVQTAKVHELLEARPIHRALRATREEWLSEVWLELLNPTITVAKREAKGAALPLGRRVDSAVMRAEKILRTRAKDNALLATMRNRKIST